MHHHLSLPWYTQPTQKPNVLQGKLQAAEAEKQAAVAAKEAHMQAQIAAAAAKQNVKSRTFVAARRAAL